MRRILKNEQRLASARQLSVLMTRPYLHLLLWESAVAASIFFSLLERLSPRVLPASFPTRSEVTRHDLGHGILDHLLSLLRYRVGLKSWIDRHRFDVGVDSQFLIVRQVMSLAHRNNVLSHARVFFNYVGAHSGGFAAAKYGAVYAFGIRNSIGVFPHIQPGRVASAIGCSPNVSYIHSRFLLFLLGFCACSIAYAVDVCQMCL